MTPLIKVEEVTRVYGSGPSAVEALAGVSLQIEAGEFVAIMGPSGSGKSTLMHILGCLDKPTSGTYYLDGKEVSAFSGNELAFLRRRRIGFVFQRFNLLPRLSAAENVELPLLYAGVPASRRRETVAALLAQVGLAGRARHRPNELSGGEAQRVAVARALANDPAIILADEPTGNLDSKSEVELMELFVRLNAGGRTVVVVTHEPEVARYARRVIQIRDGRVV